MASEYAAIIVVFLIVGFQSADVNSTSRSNHQAAQASTIYLAPAVKHQAARSRRSSDTSGMPRYRPIYHIGVSSGMDVIDHHHGNAARHPVDHDGGSATSAAGAKGTHPAALLHHVPVGAHPHAVPVAMEEKPLVRTKRLKRSTSADVSNNDRRQLSTGSGAQNEKQLVDLASPSSKATPGARKGGSGNSNNNERVHHADRTRAAENRGRGDETAARTRARNRGQARTPSGRKGASIGGDLGERSELIKTIKAFRKDRNGGHGLGSGRRNDRKKMLASESEADELGQRQRQPVRQSIARQGVGQPSKSGRHRSANSVDEHHHAHAKQGRRLLLGTAQSSTSAGGQLRVMRQDSVHGSKTPKSAAANGNRGKSGHRRQKNPELSSPRNAGHGVGGLYEHRVSFQTIRRPPSAAASALSPSVAEPFESRERINASPKAAASGDSIHRLLSEKEMTRQTAAADATIALKRQRRSNRWKPPAAMAAEDSGQIYRTSRPSAATFKSGPSVFQMSTVSRRSKRSTGRSLREKMELVKREQLAVQRRLAALNKARSVRQAAY